MPTTTKKDTPIKKSTAKDTKAPEKTNSKVESPGLKKPSTVSKGKCLGFEAGLFKDGPPFS